MLNDLRLLQISEEHIEEIEQNTRGQTSSVEWIFQRRHRLTASNFHTICHLKFTTMNIYAKQILEQHSFHSRATSHGIINEITALQKY